VKKLTTIDGIEEIARIIFLANSKYKYSCLCEYRRINRKSFSSPRCNRIGEISSRSQLVRKLISSGIKVIIVDFTGEFKNKLSGMNILP
jgi:hypothetical protein